MNQLHSSHENREHRYYYAQRNLESLLLKRSYNPIALIFYVLGTHFGYIISSICNRITLCTCLCVLIIVPGSGTYILESSSSMRRSLPFAASSMRHSLPFATRRRLDSTSAPVQAMAQVNNIANNQMNQLHSSHENSEHRYYYAQRNLDSLLLKRSYNPIALIFHVSGTHFGYLNNSICNRITWCTCLCVLIIANMFFSVGQQMFSNHHIWSPNLLSKRKRNIPSPPSL